MTKEQSTTPPPHISIIIPVRNDAEALQATPLITWIIYRGSSRLRCSWPLQVTDRARHLRSLAVRNFSGLTVPPGHPDERWCGSRTGRGVMVSACGFLQPVQALKLIRQALLPERVVGGAFAHRFAESVWSLHVINWMNRLRYRLTHNYYGDQGLFVRTAVFARWIAIARFN